MGAFPIFQSGIPATLPVVESSLEQPVQPIGAVAVATFLSDATPEGTCFDIAVVDTGGSGFSLSEARQRALEAIQAASNR